MLTAYNSQSVTFSDITGGKTNNITSSFNVVYRSSSTIKVTSTFASTNTSETITAWILKNGTTLAVSVAGQNFTGTAASSFIIGAFSGFYEEIAVGGQQSFYSSASQYFHSTGTSTATIGTNKVTVTNYAANSPNEAVTVCGTTSTYTTFSLSIGTPSGTTFPLVTNLQLAGTTDVNGTPTSFAYTLQVTAFTLA
jgi:hypothetical protein